MRMHKGAKYIAQYLDTLTLSPYIALTKDMQCFRHFT